MHEIIRLGLVDREFIANRTSNYDELARTVADYPPERAAQITGVDADTIREVARTWGEAGAAVVYWGMGISQHTTGTDNARCLIALCSITGNVGPPGHRAAPAARAEQRAGRLGRRADPDVLPRLPGRGPRETRAAVRGGLGTAARPEARADRHRDHQVGTAARRRARHVHARREPVPVRPEHQQGAKGAGRAGLPRGAGHLPDRDRRVRRRDPARDLLPGEGRHLHQHRPPGAAGPQGDGPARAGPPGLGDRPGHRPADRPGLELRRAQRGLRRDGRADAVVPEPALRQPRACPGSSTRTPTPSTPTARS